MAKSDLYVKKILDEMDKVNTIESAEERLMPFSPQKIAAMDPGKFSKESGHAGQRSRLDFLHEKGINTDYISGKKSIADPDSYIGNIENFIGLAQIPIGIAGPLLINGTQASGDYFIPMATTEGALIASYSRGMKICRMSGGIASVCLVEGVQRSPYFKFETIVQVGHFIKWVHQRYDTMVKIVSESSNYAELKELKTNIEGNSVILTFEYYTGDASGQNMVTICTDKICKYILANFDIEPVEWYIESNYSGDKKATSVSFANVRGKKVVAEIKINKDLVTGILKTTPEAIAKYWQASTLAVTQSGAIGAQGHIANCLAAIFIACGQDVACISESSVGLTRMEVTASGDLYTSLTLPSLMIGTVGGGTSLPTQQECLQILDCAGAGKAKKFAEICCAVALAGEISIAAAMSADHFTSAHQDLGRKKI